VLVVPIWLVIFTVSGRSVGRQVLIIRRRIQYHTTPKASLPSLVDVSSTLSFQF
jgi:hypothetical protein